MGNVRIYNEPVNIVDFLVGENIITNVKNCIALIKSGDLKINGEEHTNHKTIIKTTCKINFAKHSEIFIKIV